MTQEIVLEPACGGLPVEDAGQAPSAETADPAAGMAGQPGSLWAPRFPDRYNETSTQFCTFKVQILLSLCIRHAALPDVECQIALLVSSSSA